LDREENLNFPKVPVMLREPLEGSVPVFDWGFDHQQPVDPASRTIRMIEAVLI
jgi:hypothetical protein